MRTSGAFIAEDVHFFFLIYVCNKRNNRPQKGSDTPYPERYIFGMFDYLPSKVIQHC